MSYQFYYRIYFSLIIATLLSVIASTPAWANDTTATSVNTPLVQKLWKLNDNDLLLNNIKASMLNGNQSLLNDLSPKDAAGLTKIVDNNFAEIKSHMLQYMAQNGSTTQLQKALNWLNTATGKKVSNMHLFAQILFTDPEIRIPVKPPIQSQQRADLQDQFITIMFNTINKFQTAVLGHFMALQNQTRDPEQRWSDLKLEQQTKLATVSVSSITSQVLPYMFHKLFKDLSLEEVDVVVNYVGSDAGRNYNDLLLDAFVHAIEQTRDTALLQIDKLFNNKLAILSQYSKVKLSSAKQRELMALLIKLYGKPMIIRAMIDARNGEITIKTSGNDTREVYGRPNHNLVTLDTLMMDLSKSGMDIRGFYQVLKKDLQSD